MDFFNLGLQRLKIAYRLKGQIGNQGLILLIEQRLDSMFELPGKLSSSNRLTHAWQDNHRLKQNNSNMLIDSDSYCCAACCCFATLLESNKLTRAWINSYMIENNMLCWLDWNKRVSKRLTKWRETIW